MNKNQYIEDLKDIKDMMNKSSKFISLSGWSGISIGILALLASLIAYQRILSYKDISVYNTGWGLANELFVIGFITLFVSLFMGIIFTYQKSKRLGQKIWNQQTKNLLWNLFIPLVIGGALCLSLFNQGLFIYIAPLTLIFYGLALINASKYTFTEIRSLGITNCVLGLLGINFVGYGLLLWSIGFGILHIIYGILMKVKHG